MLADVKRAAVQLSRAREVIADNRIIALYQPQINLVSGDIVGFEALLRYRNSNGKLGVPESLEEAFHDYELAAKIGELIQRTVARDARSWIRNGVKFARVSINAAPAEFLRDDYAERLLRILEQHDVPTLCFDVEITEHAFLDRGPEYVARALNVLRSNGVSVSLDDFGTGSSSLSHLRDFSVDHVKIDRSFVAGMDKKHCAASLVGGVISLAHSLGVKAVAEGVETRAQGELLRMMGCEVGQGHLYSKPLLSEKVAGFIAGHTSDLALAG
jgi:EAL domain-containing protein (putative c-di-GMP-specific phosphodiesterase class I)